MMRSYRVKNDHDGLRLDRWFKKNIAQIPQGLIEKFLRLGKIKVNKKKVKSSFKLRKNSMVYVFDLKLKKQFDVKKFIIPSKHIIKSEQNIIFNHDDFIVINKDPGISVQGGTKSKVNLVDIFKRSKFFEKNHPYTVHRIDKETSGILIFAKNRKTAQFFTSLFRLRKIHKSYLCVCHGELNSISGELIHNLERYENNKIVREKAITKYKVIDRNLGFSLVQLNPVTGRKHQLRKQASLIGHPIVGDKKYFSNIKSKKNLMLHAHTIKFIMNNRKINFEADIPNYFLNFLNSKKINYLDFLKNLK